MWAVTPSLRPVRGPYGHSNFPAVEIVPECDAVCPMGRVRSYIVKRLHIVPRIDALLTVAVAQAKAIIRAFHDS